MSDSKKSDHQHKIKKHFDKKWLLINAILAVVFIVVVSVGYWLSSQNNSSKQVSIKDQKIAKLNTDAQRLANTGNGEEAAKLYDNYLKTASDSDEKITILLAKASIYANQDDYDTAIEFAKQANGINETYATVSYLAYLYEEIGDSATALGYYEKAVKLADKKSLTYEDDVAYYRKKIVTLGEGKQ